MDAALNGHTEGDGTMRHWRKLAFTTCVVVAAGAHAAPASAEEVPAPTLSRAQSCFSPATGALLTGSGWTPGGQVRLQGRYVSRGTGEALDITLPADGKGRIVFESAFRTDEAVTRGVRVTATDLSRLAAGAPATLREASVRFKPTWFGPFYGPWNTTGPASGRPGRVRIIEASGYVGQAGETLYAHYLRRQDGRFRTARVGRLRGPCGAFKLRFREFAFRNVRPGTYSVFFDTSRSASDDTYGSPGYRRVVVRKMASRS